MPGGNPGRSYDVSPDGQRFLMIKETGADGAAGAPQSTSGSFVRSPETEDERPFRAKQTAPQYYSTA